MKKNDPIIWQSKMFPKMFLTSEYLTVLKYAYGELGKFEPELRKAEAWLFSHPDRVPKKNFKAFINNWMKNAVEFKKQNAKPVQGDASSLTPRGPKVLSEILSNAQMGAAKK